MPWLGASPASHAVSQNGAYPMTSVARPRGPALRRVSRRARRGKSLGQQDDARGGGAPAVVGKQWGDRHYRLAMLAVVSRADRRRLEGPSMSWALEGDCGVEPAAHGGLLLHRIMPMCSDCHSAVPSVPASEWPTGGMSVGTLSMDHLVRDRGGLRPLSPAAIANVFTERSSVDVQTQKGIDLRVIECKSPSRCCAAIVSRVMNGRPRIRRLPDPDACGGRGR